MKLFLSYSREDQGIVEELYQDLVDVDHDVWMDVELSGGQGWWDVILGNIRDCDVLILVCTDDSLQSNACLAELRYAHALGKAIIPIRPDLAIDIELSPSPLPLLQWIPFARQDRYAELKSVLKAIRNSTSGPLPDELPEPPPVPMSYLVSFKHEIESSEPLDRASQLDLLHRMGGKVDDLANRSRLRVLVSRLREREDLFATVLPEVDSLLERLKPTEPDVTDPTAGSMAGSTAGQQDAPSLSTQPDVTGSLQNIEASPPPPPPASSTSSPPPPPPPPTPGVQSTEGVAVEPPPPGLGTGNDFFYWWRALESPAARGVAWDLLDKKQQEVIYEHIWVYQLGKKLGFKSGYHSSTYIGQPYGALSAEWQRYIQQCELGA